MEFAMNESSSTETFREVKPIKTLQYKVTVPYQYSYGRPLTRFFSEIRDNGNLVGSPCPCCHRVTVPPEEFCPLCFVELGDTWIDLPLEGRVIFFSRVALSFPGQVMEPPYVFVGMRVEGTEGALIHFLAPEDFDHIQIDSPIRVVFKPREQRTGCYFDIQYFKLII